MTAPAPMTDRALGTAPLLSLRGLDKAIDSAGQKLFLLRRIDLDVAPGDFVTIMGPSGAGKSTLLSVLGMLDHSWTGEFHFMGEAVHRLKPRDRADMMMVHGVGQAKWESYGAQFLRVIKEHV